MKDSIAIAGVPMSAGSAILQGFTPDHDSEVVTRLLAAGAEIVATTNMDDLVFSGAAAYCSPEAGPTWH